MQTKKNIAVLDRTLRAHLLHLSALKSVYIHLPWAKYFKDPREYLSTFNNFKYQGALNYLNPKPSSAVKYSFSKRKKKKIIGHQVPYDLYDLFTLLDHPLLPFLKVYSSQMYCLADKVCINNWLYINTYCLFFFWNVIFILNKKLKI